MSPIDNGSIVSFKGLSGSFHDVETLVMDAENRLLTNRLSTNTIFMSLDLFSCPSSLDVLVCAFDHTTFHFHNKDDQNYKPFDVIRPWNVQWFVAGSRFVDRYC